MQAALPTAWVCQRIEDDYGLDFHVEVFSPDGQPTGHAFYIQLRGTDERSLAKALRLRLRVDHSGYWRAHALPVLIFRYHAPSGELYARWFHSFDPFAAGLSPDWERQQTFTFELLEPHRWGYRTAETLASEIAAFRRFRSPQLPTPVRFFVRTEAGRPSATELRGRLTVAARPVDHLLSFAAKSPPPGEPVLQYRADAIVADLVGVASVTSHVGLATTPDSALASDGILVCAIALDRVGQANFAAQIAFAVAEASSLLAQPDVVWWLATVAARAHRVGEALQLADRLDARGDDEARAAAAILLSAFLAQGEGVRTSLRASYNRVVSNQAARRLDSGDVVGAAGCLYSLANSYRDAGDKRNAMRYYRQAARASPSYREAPYFNAELGGILYEAGHHLISAAFYARAIELGADGMPHALHADALLYAGLYASAQAEFDAHLALDTISAPEWRLKRDVLPEIRRVGGDVQQRQPAGAVDIVNAAIAQPDLEVALAEVDRALEQDAACGAAWMWFALLSAEHDHRAGREHDAEALATRLLIAAVLKRHDGEAWSNAIIALWHRDGDSDMLRDSVASGRYLAGEQLIPFVIERSRDWADQGDSERFIEVIGSLEPPESPRDFRIRFRRDDGKYEEFVFDPAA